MREKSYLICESVTCSSNACVLVQCVTLGMSDTCIYMYMCHLCAHKVTQYKFYFWRKRERRKKKEEVDLEGSHLEDLFPSLGTRG